VRERPVLVLGDDLLDQGVIAMPLISLDGRQGAVGDERMVAVGREQLALLGAAGCQRLEPFDPAHDQPAGHALCLAAAGERDEVDFGDLGVADPAVLVLVGNRVGYSMGCHACVGMLVIAAVTVAVIRAVTENQVPWRRAVPTNAWP
jgi:hypothetical protein